MGKKGKRREGSTRTPRLVEKSSLAKCHDSHQGQRDKNPFVRSSTVQGTPRDRRQWERSRIKRHSRTVTLTGVMTHGAEYTSVRKRNKNFPNRSGTKEGTKGKRGANERTRKQEQENGDFSGGSSKIDENAYRPR